METITGPLNEKAADGEWELHPIQSASIETSQPGMGLVDMFNKLRQDKQLFDVTIIAGDKHIEAHKSLLVASSSYFKCMFKGQFKESRDNIVTIKEMDQQGVEMIIDYFYTRKLIIDSSNVQQILACATLFDLEVIQSRCLHHLEDILDTENCLCILEIAKLYSLAELTRSAFVLCLKNFEQASQQEDFLLLSYKTLIEIVSSNHLDVISETIVYEAILRWLKHSMDERLAHWSNLINCVRFAQLDPSYLTTLDKEPLIGCHIPSIGRRWARDRLCAVLGDGTMETYNPIKDKWDQINATGLDKFILSALGQLVAIEDELYLIQPCRRTMQFYDSDFGLWSSNVKPPPTDRLVDCASAGLDGFVYLVVGEVDHEVHTSVHRYDTRCDTWTQSPPLKYPRVTHSTATLDGCIYAVGGRQDYRNIASHTVERYDPRTDKWQTLAPMKHSRWYSSSTSLNGCLYAMGGGNRLGPVEFDEKYEPRTNSWHPIKRSYDYYGSLRGCASLEGLLYAVTRGTIEKKNFLQAYDPETNRIDGQTGTAVGLLEIIETQLVGQDLCGANKNLRLDQQQLGATTMILRCL